MDVLVSLVLVVVLAVSLLIAVFAGVLVATSWAMSRANRVSPKIPTQAPNLWRWSLGTAARMHRRLQKVAALARAARAASGASGFAVADIAADIERQAVVLDDQVVLASRFPTAQRVRRMFELEGQVRELEQMTLRVTVLAGNAGTGRADEALLPIQERLVHLEQAMAELRRLEAEALGEVRAVGELESWPPRTGTG